MKDTKILTGRNEGAAKRLEKELCSANAEKDRYEQVLERVQSTMLGGSRAQLVIEDMKRCSKTLARVEADRDCTIKEVDDLEMKLANLSSTDAR